MNVGEGVFMSGLYLIPANCDGNSEYARNGEDMWFWRCALCRWWYSTEISLTYESRHDIDSRSNDESLRESIHSCAGLTFIGYNS